MIKQILFIVTITVSPSLIYAGSDCEVVSTSLYDDTSGPINGGVGFIYTTPCATVTIKNTSGGGRLGGKVMAISKYGKIITHTFRSHRISHGELHTTTICWSRTFEIDSIGCEF